MTGTVGSVSGTAELTFEPAPLAQLCRLTAQMVMGSAKYQVLTAAAGGWLTADQADTLITSIASV